MVARALEIARRRSGKTQEEMVRALSPFQSRRTERAHPQRWHDWVSKPSSVSSLALIAAARLANMPLDALLAQASTSTEHVPGAPAESLSPDFEVRLAQLADLVIRLQDTVDNQGQLLDQVAKEVLQSGRRSRSTEPTAHQPAGQRQEMS
jgi:hypothetical protein